MNPIWISLDATETFQFDLIWYRMFFLGYKRYPYWNRIQVLTSYQFFWIKSSELTPLWLKLIKVRTICCVRHRRSKQRYESLPSRFRRWWWLRMWKNGSKQKATEHLSFAFILKLGKCWWLSSGQDKQHLRTIINFIAQLSVSGFKNPWGLYHSHALNKWRNTTFMRYVL